MISRGLQCPLVFHLVLLSVHELCAATTLVLVDDEVHEDVVA